MSVAQQQSDLDNHHGGGSSAYTFSSRPRAIEPNTRYRYFDEMDQAPFYGNIMYDRRIVRGNTYARKSIPVSLQPDPIELQKKDELRKRLAARKRVKQLLKPRTPDPLDGRQHVDIQTEMYLEELTDRIEETDMETQTDTFLNRPHTPLYIPAKTGIDVETQILEGELFDFNVEVCPVLEVLIGKTIEQSLLEVVEEEELANLRKAQRRYEELRNAELVETQRLEEQERRHREEKDRRKKQQYDVLRKEKETTDKIAALAYVQNYLQDLVPSVFGNLHNAGYFYDPVERDIETNFMEWLMDGVSKEVVKATVSKLILDTIIRDVSIKRNEIYTKLNEEHEKKIRDSIRLQTPAKGVKPTGKIEEPILEGVPSPLELPNEPVITIEENDSIPKN